jgi:hypothetical protein
MGSEHERKAMSRVVPVFIVLLAALASAPLAFAAAPPRPVLVSPADGKEFPPPSPRDVTFKVKGQVDEAAGSLHIQLTDPDGEVAADGSFENENGVADYVLEPTKPGGSEYRVTVPATDFESYSDPRFYWQAYRTLSEPDCTPIGTTGKRDCFQESAEPREFMLVQPAGYGSYEPNNSPATATSEDEYLNNECAYLEARNDVDWFRYDGSSRAFELRLKLENTADTDRWVPLKSRKRESADMSVSVYKAKGVRKIASKHVAVGKTKVLKTKLRAKTAYLFAFRHAGNGFRSAKPAADMNYFFHLNLPGNGGMGCV